MRRKYYLGIIYAFMSFLTVLTFDIKVAPPKAGVIYILLKSYIPKIIFASIVVMAIYSFIEYKSRRDLYISIILGIISVSLVETYYVFENLGSIHWLTTMPMGTSGGMRMPIYISHLIPLIFITIIVLYKKQGVKMLAVLSIILIATYLLLNVRWNGVRFNVLLWGIIELFVFFMSLPIVINKTMTIRSKNLL